MALDAGPEPIWVKRGCESGIWQARRVFCSVGQAYGYQDPSLAVSAAQLHGRTALVATISSQVTQRLEEVSGHTTSQIDGKIVEQNDLKSDAKQVIDRTVSGIRAEQSWTSTSGVVYALMVVDQDRIDAEIARVAAPAPTPAAPASPTTPRKSGKAAPHPQLDIARRRATDPQSSP